MALLTVGLLRVAPAGPGTIAASMTAGETVPDIIRPSIGYVTSRYPLVTHTFIQREVLGLRAAGFSVETAAMVKATEDQLLSPTDHDEAARSINLRPLSARSVVAHLVRPILRHPLAFAATVRISAKGWWTDPRQLLWRLLYALEGTMLWSLMRSKDVQHLHAHHANVAANVAWLATEMGRRVGTGPHSWTFTMHGPEELTDLERTELGRKAQAAAGVACISDFTRSQVMMVTPETHWDRFTVVHCGVDPAVYTPREVPRDRDAPFTVLFVGRLDPVKGLPVLIDAMGILQADLAPTPVRLLVVGGGAWQTEGERRCAELGLDVEFAGAVGQHEIVPYFHRADAFALASFREGLPVVLMEAMACGVPVVASRITAAAELIEDDVSGLLATAGRSDHFAAQLRRLVDDPDLAARLGAAGREKVLAEFTTAGTIEAMIEFFDRFAA
jgi:glycosyltransferase involved in cell wall biosynthesis